jgi:hypothetical protein
MLRKDPPRVHESWFNGAFTAACLSGCVLECVPAYWQFGVIMIAAMVSLAGQAWMGELDAAESETPR